MSLKISTTGLFVFYLPKNAPERTRVDFSLLDLTVASARQAAAAGKIHFYTRESAVIPADLPATRVVRIAPAGLSPADVQLIRACAMRDFVHSAWFRNPTIAVEYDEFLERNPASAFEPPFDVVLTYSCWKKNKRAMSASSTAA